MVWVRTAFVVSLVVAAFAAAAGCLPSVACDASNPNSCPVGESCVEGACVAGDGDGDTGDGDGDTGDGDGDTGDGDGDGDTCSAANQDDCDGDGQCEYLNQNPNHCGVCGNACPDGPCVAGVCQAGPLLEDLRRPYFITAHEGYVYFTEHGNTGGEDGAVRRFPVGNPAAIENLAAGMESPRGFAFDGGYLYFFEDRWQIADALWRTPMGGPPTAAELLVDDLDANNGDSYDPPYGLAASGGYVFYMNDDGLYRKGHQATAIDEVSTGGYFAKGLLADESYVYFVYSGVAYRLPVDFATVPAPEPQAIATLPDGHTTLFAYAQDAGFLYWSTNPYEEGGIVQVAKDGSTTTLLVADVDPLDEEDDSSMAVDLAVDDTHVYYVTGAYSYRVFRVAKVPGAEPEILAEADDPSGIAVDDDFVYWTEFAEGTIMRVAK